MPVPKFHEFFLSLLKQLEDGKEHSISDLRKKISIDFKLSSEDLKERTSSGYQTTFYNRVHWSKIYLKKACLIDQPSRGFVIITNRGKKVLEENLTSISVSYLRQFPEFCKFQNLRKPKNSIKEDSDDTQDDSQNDTPLEQLESAYKTLQSNLKHELLENIMKCEPFFFEKLVVNLLINLGYGGFKEDAGKAFSTTRDEGIDGVIKEDKLGLDQIYIQAKRWNPDNTVARPEIQKFAGALQGKRAKKGVFITTSRFSRDATEYVKNLDSKIILIDGDSLTDYMIESNTGVLVEDKYEIKKIDNNYFEDED